LQRILSAKKQKAIAVRVKKMSVQGMWSRMAAAAVIIAIVTTVTYVVSTRRLKEEQINTATIEQVIHPGGDKALLTLADGTVVDLNAVPDGTLQQGGDHLIKKNGGILEFDEGASPARHASYNAFNVLSTPRGGQFRVVLPDGSNVWLNAESSLKFPVEFDQHLREVELTGEAYFEIKPAISAKKGSAKTPFNVLVNLPSGKKANVRVVGTHFNVNAYANEGAMKTTLIEGMVRVSEDKQVIELKPGQQANILEDGSLKLDVDADVEGSIAWKNGIFHFDNAGIAAIMRQIGRWYDVEVVYAGKVPSRHFVGKIRRSAELSEVLEILRLSGIDFRVSGKTIVVQ
jgi:ferric-dicitrate binding protein FerR (iron transport regulator)